MSDPQKQLEALPLDVDHQAVAEVYAKALWGVAQRADATEVIMEQLSQWVDQVLGRHPRVQAVLESPRVPQAERERLLDAALAGRAAEPLLRFLKVLVRHGRFQSLPYIRNSLRRLYNQARGLAEATVTTAQPLDDATRQQVSQRLAQVLGKQVQLQARVDPSIIGGLVVRVGDTVYDNSLRNQLLQARRAALERTIGEIRSRLPAFATEKPA